MANRTLNTRLRLKYDTAANWATKNPVLLAGEVGIESDTLLGKVGDGTKAWQQLDYLNAGFAKRVQEVFGVVAANKIEGQDNLTITYNGEELRALGFDGDDFVGSWLYDDITGKPDTSGIWISLKQSIKDILNSALRFDVAQSLTDNQKIQARANIDAAKSDHTHNYAGSSSAGGAATSANKVNSNLIVKLNNGETEGTNLFTFNGSAAKTINITPSAIGAAASSHNHDDKYLGKTAKAADSDKLDGKDSTYYLNKITALEGKPGLDKVGTVTSINANGTSFNPDATGKIDLGNIGGGSGPLQFSDVVVMTEAEFSEAYLAGTLQDDKLYLIEGETGTVNFVSTADHIVYSNTNSGLVATNVQLAIDEVKSKLFSGSYNDLTDKPSLTKEALLILLQLTSEQLTKLIAFADKITVDSTGVEVSGVLKATSFDAQ